MTFLPNERPALDAAMRIRLHVFRQWRGASLAGR
jgi:hypothetical protein